MVNLASLASAFVREFIIGTLFGMVWFLPKWGNRILAGCLAIAAIYLMINPSISISIFADYWYVNAFKSIGFISGLLFGWLLIE